MPELRLDFYKGNDQYSDGDVEDVLLEIAKGDVDKINEVNPFAYLYHFSDMRENILSWYPLEGKSVLEIGAGCGAITGMLCRKAEKVVSIDLSKRRLSINMERNKACDNLTLYAGNLYDIKLNEEFDVVVVNGVMEYAISFTEGDTPYDTFLQKAKSFAKSTGEIVLAIENRLGLKYFAGAPEDHTDTYFLGVNSYKGNNTVRTFSKQELMELFSKNGLCNLQFYYPYPDYKFPREIFSDRSIHRQVYGKPYHSYSGHRFELFNESEVAESLVTEGVIESFANSFLVIAKAQSEEVCDIDYVKFSNERANRFKIMTYIDTNDKVYKCAMNSLAEEHIKKICENSKSNVADTISYLEFARVDNEKIVCDYIKSDNINTIIMRLNREKRFGDIIAEIDAFILELNKICVKTKYSSDDFYTVFGNSEEKEELCLCPANIDLILENVYKINEKYCLIDGEWIFDFPIPLKFIIWRMIDELFNNHRLQISRTTMLQHYEITADDERLYRSWNHHFVEKYVGANLYEKYSVQKDWLNLNDVRNTIQYADRIVSSVYFDRGEDFSESDKIWTDSYKVNNHWITEFKNINLDNVKRLRLDIIDGEFCKIKLLNVRGTDNIRPINAADNIDGYDVFFTDDPNYIIYVDDSMDGTLKVEYELEVLKKSAISQNMRKKDASIREMREEKARRDMENNLIVEQNLRLQNQFEEAQNQLEEAQNQLEETRNQLTVLSNDIISIRNSKTWKLANRFAKVRNVFRRRR